MNEAVPACGGGTFGANSTADCSTFPYMQMRPCCAVPTLLLLLLLLLLLPLTDVRGHAQAAAVSALDICVTHLDARLKPVLGGSTDGAVVVIWQLLQAKKRVAGGTAEQPAHTL